MASDLIEVQEWFSSPVWKAHIDVDTESIISYLYQLQKTDSGTSKSNKGGWQSHALPNPPQAHYNLVNEVNKVLASVHHHMGLKSTTSTTVSHSWYNINRLYNYNCKHIHPGSTFSGVVYLNVPDGDCGDIVFSRENSFLSFFHHIGVESYNEKNSAIARYKPIRSMLLVFPSWMEHEVLPNQTNQDRISFSFNSSTS